jgi:hypothetical protein
MCNNFLQQMEIDALEELISEDVKVKGQISCVMVSELASCSSELSPELLPESSPEEEVYQHHSSARVAVGGVRAHLNAHGPLLPSC